MKPRTIYESTFIRRSHELYPVGGFLGEVDTSNPGLDDQTRVEWRTHYDPYIDGTRNATLYSVWFRHHRQGNWIPVMLCKTGGRPDYEHHARYITNHALYGVMCAYLKDLEIKEEWEVEREREDYVDIDEDVAGLDIVYGTPIAPIDLGKLAHVRREFYNRNIVGWDSLRAWPYDGYKPVRRMSLAEKQRQRWERLQKEVAGLVKEDPECKLIAELSKTEQGTDDIIAQMGEHLRKLLGRD